MAAAAGAAAPAPPPTTLLDLPNDVLVLILSLVEDAGALDGALRACRSLATLHTRDDLRTLWLRNQRPRRALAMAARAGMEDALVALMCVHGISADAQDDTSALHLAAGAGLAGAVHCLLHVGLMDVNDELHGSRALHAACGAGSAGVVGVLLEQPGVDVNAVDGEGDTALCEWGGGRGRGAHACGATVQLPKHPCTHVSPTTPPHPQASPAWGATRAPWPRCCPRPACGWSRPMARATRPWRWRAAGGTWVWWRRWWARARM